MNLNGNAGRIKDTVIITLLLEQMKHPATANRFTKHEAAIMETIPKYRDWVKPYATQIRTLLDL
jgi:hypothetical protein